MINRNFENSGVTHCIVKWTDRYNRPFSRQFSDVNTARQYYKALCSSDPSGCGYGPTDTRHVYESDRNPMFASFTAFTVEGSVVLGEYRPS